MIELRGLARSAKHLGRRLIAGLAPPLERESQDFVAAPSRLPMTVPPRLRTSYQGGLHALSAWHADGWIANPEAPGERMEVEVFIETSGEVLARSRADLRRFDVTVGDGRHAFYARFDRPATADELPQLRVRVAEDRSPIAPLPHLSVTYEPIMFMAMDIVDNCNLRCPFCLYDYAATNRTNFMSEATIDAALRFLPYTTDGNFWFSCLHEPTLHPQLMQFVDKVPADQRRKLFYTTNLAKRMPDSYYDWLANTAMHHINVSIESMEPALYERMRKGARHRIFAENWDKLVAAFKCGGAPPKLRYISMVYKSNLRELPGLVAHLLNEREGHQVELRYTFDVPHLDPAFRQTEFLDPDEWRWLRDELAGYSPEQLQLSLPPGLDLPPPGSNQPSDDSTTREATQSTAMTEPPTSSESPDMVPVAAKHAADNPALAAAFLRGRYGCRLSADGKLEVNRALSDYTIADAPLVKVLNVRDIADVDRFIAELPY